MINHIMATTTDFFNSTGKRIRIMREERGINQTELAEELEVAPSYVSQLEKDRREPSVDVLVKLVKQLKTSADYLLMLSDEPDKAAGRALDRYISPEADTVAEIIDSLPMASRTMMLALTRIVADHERQRTDEEFSNLLGYVESTLGRVARQQVEQAFIARKRRNGGPA